MSGFRPVETAKDLSRLDEDEVLRGYLDGMKCNQEPGSAFSRSYWHGWRNAQVDKGRLQPDVHQDRLVRDLIGARCRGH